MDQEQKAQLVIYLNQSMLPWQTSLCQGAQPQTFIKWFPVTEFAESRIRLGLSSSALWVRQNSHSVIEFSSKISCVFLLPILEMPFDEVHGLLKKDLLRVGLSEEFLKTFPFNEVVIEGLKSYSEHWIGLALEWVEAIPASTEIQNAVLILVNSGPSQELRHKAKRKFAHLKN